MVIVCYNYCCDAVNIGKPVKFCPALLMENIKKGKTYYLFLLDEKGRKRNRNGRNYT